MTTTTDQVSDLQVTHVRYDNHLEWEDGPGSLQNVVSDTSEPRVVCTTRITLADAKQLSREDFEHCIWFEEDSADGWTEHSYKLEWLNPDTGKWGLVGFL